MSWMGIGRSHSGKKNHLWMRMVLYLCPDAAGIRPCPWVCVTFQNGRAVEWVIVFSNSPLISGEIGAGGCRNNNYAVWVSDITVHSMFMLNSLFLFRHHVIFFLLGVAVNKIVKTQLEHVGYTKTLINQQFSWLTAECAAKATTVMTLFEPV